MGFYCQRICINLLLQIHTHTHKVDYLKEDRVAAQKRVEELQAELNKLKARKIKVEEAKTQKTEEVHFFFLLLFSLFFLFVSFSTIRWLS